MSGRGKQRKESEDGDEMIQLMINGVAYPETTHDRYKCYTEDLGEDMRMVNSRLITEVRARIVVIEYSYDYFKDALMRTCLRDLRGGADLEVQYLAPEENALQSGVFRCTRKPSPTFAFSVNGSPRWHNISFKLEEVEGR